MNRIGKGLRNNIVVGLVLVAPLAITGYIVYFLIRLVSQNALTRIITELIFELIPEALKDGAAKVVLSQIIALVLVCIALFSIGFFVRSYFGRRLYRLAERILVRIPVFNKIYVQVRHVSETIFAQRQTMFKQVVLVESPRKGVYSVAFVTSFVPSGFRRHIPLGEDKEERIAALFVPTTPNPTSGLMIFVPESDFIPLNLTVAEAMKLVISAGTVYPGDEGVFDERPTLLDKLEHWITRETNLEPPTHSDTEKRV